MSDVARKAEGKLSVEPPSPAAVTKWANATDQHLQHESEAMLLIRELQQRVHRLEQLVRAYGLKLQE